PRPCPSGACGAATGRTRASSQNTSRTTPCSSTCSATGCPTRRFATASWWRTRRPCTTSRRASRRLLSTRGRVAKLDDVLRADRGRLADLRLSRNDAEALLANAAEHLIRDLRRRVAAGQPLREALAERLGHRAGLALLGQLVRPVAWRPHDARVY